MHGSTLMTTCCGCVPRIMKCRLSVKSINMTQREAKYPTCLNSRFWNECTDEFYRDGCEQEYDLLICTNVSKD